MFGSLAAKCKGNENFEMVWLDHVDLIKWAAISKPWDKTYKRISPPIRKSYSREAQLLITIKMRIWIFMACSYIISTTLISQKLLIDLKKLYL